MDRCMDNFRIYLAGGMSGLSREDKRAWRKEVRDLIIDGIEFYGYDYMPLFFNPLMHYDYDADNSSVQCQKSEREIFELDIYNLRKSELVIVNFNNPSSIGTAMELAIAKDHSIPIVGLNENGSELHPWLIECCTRICDTMDELLEHVAFQYLMN